MATTEITKPNQGKRDLKVLLESRIEDFSQALAGRIDPQAFLRVAYTSVAKNTQLASCTPASVMMALLEAASLGLVPHGVMGEAYLVKYNTKVKITEEKGRTREEWQDQAQLQVGYRGLVKLARQSGVIRTIVPRPVYEGEAFAVEYGTNERIEHSPLLDTDTDTKKPLFVYAVAHFTDGSTQFEVMSAKAADQIKARSKSKDRSGNITGPWLADYTEMALKTVVRRLCKRLPLSDFDLAQALELDNEDFDLGATSAQGARTGAANLNDRLRNIAEKTAKAQQAEEVPEAEYEVVKLSEEGQPAQQVA